VRIEHVVDGPDSARDNEPQPVVVPTPARDQLPVFVIEVEEPLQLNAGQRPKPAVAALIGHDDMKSPVSQHRSMFSA
jgi:hypothetical protein